MNYLGKRIQDPGYGGPVPASTLRTLDSSPYRKAMPVRGAPPPISPIRVAAPVARLMR